MRVFVRGRTTAFVALGITAAGGESRAAFTPSVRAVASDPFDSGAAMRALQCVNEFRIAGSPTHGDVGNSATVREQARRSPESIAKRFVRANANIAHGRDEGTTFESSYTYDRKNPAKAGKVRIDVKTDAGALAG